MAMLTPTTIIRLQPGIWFSSSALSLSEGRLIVWASPAPVKKNRAPVL